MEITVEQIEYIFRDYNEKYFGGVLPVPEFVITNSFRYFGYFKSDIEDNTTVNPVIEISGQYDYKPSQLRDILVHEMIHYYLSYNGIEIDEQHGKEFRKMAKKLNKEYKMHITETINIDKYKRRKGTSWLKYTITKLF